jgi:hypothetical protein
LGIAHVMKKDAFNVEAESERHGQRRQRDVTADEEVRRELVARQRQKDEGHADPHRLDLFKTAVGKKRRFHESKQ